MDNINFNGYYVGKAVYPIKGEYHTRKLGSIWGCALADYNVLKKVNHLSKKNNDFVKIATELKNEQPTITFEMSITNFNKTNNIFHKLYNFFNLESTQKKLFKSKNLKLIAYELTKKDYQTLKNKGARYQYSSNNSNNYTGSLFDDIKKPMFIKKLKKIEKDLIECAKTKEQKNFLINFFSGNN